MLTKDQAAQELAQAHYELDPALLSVYRVLDREEVEAVPGEPLKLLEVNEDASPGEIVPVYLTSDVDEHLRYSALLMEVTPGEFLDIQQGKRPLPHQWRLGPPLSRHPRPQESVAA